MEVTFEYEDGSGKPNSTSYLTVDEMKQYWFDVGYPIDSLTEQDVKRLLNKSSSYIDNNYRNSFPGYRQEDVQSMEWPRSGAYYIDGYLIDENTIPPELKDAVAEMAYIYQSGNGPESIISKSGQIIAESSQVDVIKESTEYQEGTTLYTDILVSVDDALSRITGGVNDGFILDVIRVGGDSP